MDTHYSNIMLITGLLHSFTPGILNHWEICCGWLVSGVISNHFSGKYLRKSQSSKPQCKYFAMCAVINSDNSFKRIFFNTNLPQSSLLIGHKAIETSKQQRAT